LSEASREAGLEVNMENIKYMVMHNHQNVGQNHNLLTANKSSNNVAVFKQLRTIGTNQNCIHKHIKGSLNLRNAHYHSVQSFVLPLPLKT